MPLQNRVTPFGEIVSISQRGLFIGNRGIIHNPATRTLLKKRWSSRAWLICSCEYKGVRRDVVAGRSWTELFFLDEATALAAGHRPCFLCRREAAIGFQDAWSRATGETRPTAATMDRTLHQERLENGRQRRHGDAGFAVSELPDGVMVRAEKQAWVIVRGHAHVWAEAGYGAGERLETAEAILTPPSTLAALRAGYRPVVHPTAGE